MVRPLTQVAQDGVGLHDVAVLIHQPGGLGEGVPAAMAGNTRVTPGGAFQKPSNLAPTPHPLGEVALHFRVVDILDVEVEALGCQRQLDGLTPACKAVQSGEPGWVAMQQGGQEHRAEDRASDTSSRAPRIGK